MLDMNILLALYVELLELSSMLLEDEHIPLRTIAHRQDELGTYQEDTGEAKHRKYVQANTVSERIERRI